MRHSLGHVCAKSTLHHWASVEVSEAPGTSVCKIAGTLFARKQSLSLREIKPQALLRMPGCYL